MRDDLKLLLSCYACEPHRGSEPGVGWAWALGMAKRHETWVITRVNNRAAIETELSRLAVPAEERPHFVWVDLPKWIRCLKKRRVVPVSLYYLLWQFAARRAWDRSGVKVDVVHHVTFNSFVVPGVWWRRREKVVLGPLGGMSICATSFLRCFPPLARFVEWARGLSRRFWRLDVFFRRSRRNAAFLFFTTTAMRECLGSTETPSSVLLETAVPTALADSSGFARRVKRERRFVWAGTLAGHKAGDLAIRAFSTAFAHEKEPPVLEIFGKGPDEKHLKEMASRLGVGASVRFCGIVAQEYLWHRTVSSLANIFTSVRDTSGNVALEALACETPVICFNHQGVAEIVDSSCALTVEPRCYEEAVVDFAAAMRKIADDPGLADRLGAAGRKRVMAKFTWERKFDAADAVYAKIVSGSR